MLAWTGRLAVLGWLAVALVSAGGWYVTATRLTRIAGGGDLAPAVGALAAAVAVTLVWRWASDDRRRSALGRGLCPACRAPLAWRHEHADGRMGGLIAAECVQCGFAHAEEGDCPDCAA